MSYNKVNFNHNIPWPTYQASAIPFNKTSGLNIYNISLKDNLKSKEILTKLSQSCELEKKFENSLIETIKQIRNLDSLKPVKIETQSFKRIENINLAEEYSGLSYLNGQNNNIVNNLNNNLNFQSAEQFKITKKNSELDFRVKYKTEKCKFWEINQTCKFGDGCAFAHGNQDIRDKFSRTSNYKTKKCKQFFENGYCSYGSRCQFLHKDNSSKTLHRLNSFSYKKSIDSLKSITQDDHQMDIKDLFNNPEKRPRLRTFEKIAKISQQSDSDSNNKYYSKISYISQNNQKINSNIERDNSICFDLIHDNVNKSNNISNDEVSSPRSRFFSA